MCSMIAKVHLSLCMRYYIQITRKISRVEKRCVEVLMFVYAIAGFVCWLGCALDIASWTKE